MKNNVRKILLLFLAVALILSGCSQSGNNKGNESNISENNGEEIVIGVTSFADTLEPTEQYFSWVLTRYGVGETLVRFDENGKITPGLAEEWSVSDDKLSWTFKIRENVKFSNGDNMTPELVKDSIGRTFELAPRASTFFELDGIKVDGQNIIVKTKEPVAILPGSLADPLFLIMHTGVDNSNVEMSGPICTGPYAVEEFNPVEFCTVIKNTHYWGGEVPMDRVTFKCIDDQSTRSMALQSGEIQMAYNLKTENMVEFNNNNSIKYKGLESLRSTYAFMNQKGPLGDITLRQALIRGLDKETYCDDILKGGATPAKAPVPPTLDFGFDELNDENTYDTESARKLLEDGGYKDVDGDGFVETPSGEKLELNFVIYNSREELELYAQAAQISLKEVGINVKLNVVSYETLLDMRDSADYDLLIWNVLVANTGDPEKYLRESWYSDSPSNTSGYSNRKVDQLLDEMASTFDEEGRRDLAVEIQQLIMDDAATVFFGHETTYLFYNKKMSGVEIYPMDYYWLTENMNFEN